MHPEDVRYRIIHLIEQRPEITQRELASDLGVSLGKINYCLQALVDKGHVKLANFRRNPKRV
ncbi:MAG: winged helix-turn-helix transcriptional regulator [Pseudomonadota bacterium]